MERINHYPLYELGKALHSLRERADVDEQPARQIHWQIRNSLRALDRLLKGDPLPLGISRTATVELRADIYSIFESYFMKSDKEGKKKFELPNENVTIEPWEMIGFTTKLEKFETIFSTEMAESTTYFVPPRGIYSTAALIDFADKSFPPDIFGHIPEKAKADWRAAGRCLARLIHERSCERREYSIDARLSGVRAWWQKMPRSHLRNPRHPFAFVAAAPPS